MINFKLPPQPHQKYYITPYEELDFIAHSDERCGNEIVKDEHCKDYIIILAATTNENLTTLYNLDWDDCRVEVGRKMSSHVVMSMHSQLVSGNNLKGD